MTGHIIDPNFLGDFVVIIGSENTPVPIHPTLAGTVSPLPARFNFDTGGRVLPGAFLLCSVTDLIQGADILINDREAGPDLGGLPVPAHITGTPSGDLDTQLITINAAVLSNASGRNNRLSFKNVSTAFAITRLACFFQQEA